MSVIRTLSTSENNEQRELEKKRLEKEYKKSDAKLEALVMENAKSLKEAMHVSRLFKIKFFKYKKPK